VFPGSKCSKIVMRIFVSCILAVMFPVSSSHADPIIEQTNSGSTQVGEINRKITEILQKYMFDGNDALTRRDMSVEINKYLNKLEGLANYDVVSDKSNNSPDIILKKIVRVDVFLVFQGSNKPIVLNYEVGSSGVYEMTLLRNTN